MKKTLFSLAFVAASGVYVAAANHMFVPPDEASPAIATDTALPPAAPSPITPSAATVPLVASSQPAPPEAPQIVALAAPAPTSPRPRPAPSETPQIVAQAAPAPTPPLPRPRPAPPAPLAVQSAASTDTAAANSSGYRDGTYTGSDENAYYGRVQVQVTVTNHRIASVKVLDYPQDRRTSRYINSQALPLLKQEVIAAASANIDTVSGATLTSEAYIRSLDNALAQAGGSNA